MKKALISLLMVLAAAWTIARSAQTPQEKYIEKYSAIAVNEMYRSGVPASITLAQAGGGREQPLRHQVPQLLERAFHAGG